MTASKRLRRTLLFAAAALSALSVSSASAMAAPVFEISGQHGPTNFQPDSLARYTFWVENAGDEVIDQGRDDNGTPADPSDDSFADPVTLDVQLPAGVTTRFEGYVAPEFGETTTGFLTGPSWDCNPEPERADPEPGESSFNCNLMADVLPPGELAPITVWVSTPPSPPAVLAAEATVEGGGAAPLSFLESAPVAPDITAFGPAPGSFFADAFDSAGVPARQAGSRPFRASAAVGITLREKVAVGTPYERTVAVATGSLRNLEFTLPRGFVGNPTAVGICEPAELGLGCPIDSQVGFIDLVLSNLGSGAAMPPGTSRHAIYNMEPPRGVLADFAFAVAGNPIHIRASLDPGDYSIVTTVTHINETLKLHAQRAVFWGVPADPANDATRWNPQGFQGSWGAEATRPREPFFSLPTQCNVPDATDLTFIDSWENSGVNAGTASSAVAETVGCSQLEFDPVVSIRPTTNVADAPTGLEFDMHIPQNEDPDGLATAHLRDAVVELPAGMTVNPPSADGLSACSLAQIGISGAGVPNGDPVTCPDAAKLGSAVAVSPAIDHSLSGTVYLAEQNANPFGSLLAMYLVIEDPKTGLLIKLPGKVDPDPNTGQLTATFRNNPQLPVEDLSLVLKQGPRAALKTPANCGTHTTEATLIPWSSPEGVDVSSPSSFELIQGPTGGACLPSGSSAPNSPSFSAGTLDPTAKAFTPFTLKLTRADGTQQLKAIDTTLPKGLLGKLAGTTYCADSALSSAANKSGKDERGSASCPASSRVGSVTVGAGAGSTPLYVQGTAYLAGPYKGAPLSLAIITPAVAGPFDLGTVVVRTKLDVNPENAQIHAVSDELPTILQGIPLNIRSVALKMDRPDFTLNPTSCDPMKVEGSALSVFNQSAALSSPFQVGDCGLLGFKPTLALKLKGGTKRSDFPALTATVTARPGDANIGKTVVALPRSEFLAQSHIRTICTRVQYAAEQCPEGSIYGKATAWSPLLDQPLSGPVYLRSSSNPLPDMVVALDGQIDVDLVGRIDSFKRGIRTTFDTVPDAPVSKFVLEMQGGKKGLLENSRNLCKTVNKATVEMAGQNGAAYDSTPVLQSKCKKPKAKKKSDKKHKQRGAKTGKKG